MILSLIEDQKIVRPGAYRMSMDHYHTQCCEGPSISSSGLRIIQQESPWHFWMQSDINPDRYPAKEESDALILGKAAHALMLGDEDFDAQFIFVPEDAPRRPTAAQIAAFERNGEWSEAAAPGAKFWAEFDERAAGRMMLSDEQVKKIGYMAENLKRTPLAVDLLTGQNTEISMIWQDPTGVWVKSRPDVMPDNGADFADLKTISPRTKDIKRAVHQAITDHRYYMQMALAQMAAEQVFGFTAKECVLIFIQSTAPYTVTPVRLDEEALYWGRVECRKGIDQFAHGIETGEWPMPVTGILDYTLPMSLGERYSEMQFNGDLPSMEA